MEELRIENFQLESVKPQALFFKTPFCGTCQLAEKLLELTFQTFNGQPILTKSCRAEEWQSYIHQWKIESVPCLVFIKNGKVLEKVYAFESVTNLFQIYKKYGSF